MSASLQAPLQASLQQSVSPKTLRPVGVSAQVPRPLVELRLVRPSESNRPPVESDTGAGWTENARQARLFLPWKPRFPASGRGRGGLCLHPSCEEKRGVPLPPAGGDGEHEHRIGTDLSPRLSTSLRSTGRCCCRGFPSSRRATYRASSRSITSDCALEWICLCDCVIV